jgi:hypothetical protein
MATASARLGRKFLPDLLRLGECVTGFEGPAETSARS